MSFSHFAARIRYRTSEERDEKDLGKARFMVRERVRAEDTKLKDAGFDPLKVFKYLDGDDAAKAKAKHDCEAYAKKFNEATGVELVVSEGFFM